MKSPLSENKIWEVYAMRIFFVRYARSLIYS